MVPGDPGRSRRIRGLGENLAVWLLLAFLAVVNGGFCEVFLAPNLGEYPAHLLSTTILLAAILLAVHLYFSWTELRYTRPELVLLGVSWMTLTVAFEFLIGVLEDGGVRGVMAQYDVFAGRVWILVPLTLLAAPLFFGYRQEGTSATETHGETDNRGYF